MRRFETLVVLAASLLVSAAASSAQPSASPEALTPLQIAVACAMPPKIDLPDVATLRIVGAQDTVPRSIFDEGDRLVISGGTLRHVEVGQRYFVRHPEWPGMRTATAPHAIRTTGWIRIIAANDSTAIASVEHICSDIGEGDYLEPFTRPTVSEASTTAPAGDLDFANPSHVLHGELLRGSGGVGDFMLIDRGADEGAAQGARFAVYRDLRQPGLPLTEVGEAVVMSVGPKLSVIRITAARDSVESGDFVVPRKP